MERSPRVCPGCRLDGRCLRQSDADEAQECYQAFLQLQPIIDGSDVPSADRPARVACAPARRLRKAINPAVAHSPVYPLEIRQAAFDAAVREAVRQAQAIADYQHGVETEFLDPADTGFGG
ncbi:hypothetical protein AUJ38_01515 [bacterium CG1_02_42_9]|nr:MAG: hypothetical protein AUJ38_01515 [bacterium CG1_02_42_9]